MCPGKVQYGILCGGWGGTCWILPKPEHCEFMGRTPKNILFNYICIFIDHFSINWQEQDSSSNGTPITKGTSLQKFPLCTGTTVTASRTSLLLLSTV